MMFLSIFHLRKKTDYFNCENMFVFTVIIFTIQLFDPVVVWASNEIKIA